MKISYLFLLFSIGVTYSLSGGLYNSFFEFITYDHIGHFVDIALGKPRSNSKESASIMPTAPQSQHVHSEQGIALAKRAKENFWTKLEDGAPDDAKRMIQEVITDFEKAVPGTRIEMFFILQTNHNNQTNTTQVGTAPQASWLNYQQYLHKGTEQVNKGFNSLGEYIQQHSRTIAFFTGAALYLTVHFYLYSIRQKITTNPCWSLYEGDEEAPDYLQKLLGDIQHCYCDNCNPADFITPLIYFTQDLDEERLYLEKYHNFITIFSYLQLHRFLSYDVALHKNAQQRIRRIDHIKRSFTAWLAEFKISQVNNNPQQLLLGINRNIHGVK